MGQTDDDVVVIGDPFADPMREPDRAQLETFVNAIFKHAGSKGFVAVRSFHEHEDKVFRKSVADLVGGLAFLIEVAEDDARRAAQNPEPVVFCPPLAVFTNKDRAGEDDLKLGLVLTVECDETPTDARRTLTDLLGEPTVVTESGGEWISPDGVVEPRLHLHWRLKEPTNTAKEHDTLKEARELAAHLVGGDRSSGPIVHPIRWPGSWHRKGEPRLARIVSTSDNEVDLVEVLKILRDKVGFAVINRPNGRTPAARLLAPVPTAVESALSVIPNDERKWPEWNHIGMATWCASGGSEVGFAAFTTWSAKSKKYNARETQDRWKHYGKSPPSRVGYGTLRFWARHYHPGWDYKVETTSAITVDELNAKYCVVCDGGKTRVLYFERQVQKVGKKTHIRHVVTFMTFEDFRNFFLDEKIMVDKKPMPIGKWWLQASKDVNPGKRKYDGITFRPDLDVSVVDGKLNLWRGFGVEERPGDWSLMKEHIKLVLANGNESHATYIFKWIAWAVQNPADRAEVALVFKGKKGTGKGTLGNCLVILFGRHGTHISSKDHLAGKFNYHLRDACFLFADEAYWPGDKSAEGSLNRLISEWDLFIEGKGQNAFPAPNYLHVMMASNEEWVVPAGENERRYAVFDVPPVKIQNHDYFEAIANQMDNGGYEAMLYDLRRLDLKGWHPRKLVASEALLAQQARSLDFFDEWWSSVLDNGVIPGSITGHPDCSPPLEDFHVADDYGRQHLMPGLVTRARKTDPRRGHHVSETSIAGDLAKVGCTKKKIVYCGKQRRSWRFPDLKKARTEWERRFPGWTWSTAVDSWQPDDEPATHDNTRTTTSGAHPTATTDDEVPF